MEEKKKQQMMKKKEIYFKMKKMELRVLLYR